jgi:hypothetical protein
MMAENLRRFCEVSRMELKNTYRRPNPPLFGRGTGFCTASAGKIFQELSPDIVDINQEVVEDGL